MAVQAVQAVQVAQEEPVVVVAQEEPVVVVAQSHAAWAAVWLPTESQVPCWTAAVGYLAAVQRAVAAPAPWASLAGALFSWAAAVVVAGG